MQNLIDVYKKRLKTAQNLLKQLSGPDDKEAFIRAQANINCYNYFIFELELLKDKNSRRYNVDLSDLTKSDASICQPNFSSGKFKQKKMQEFTFNKILLGIN